MYEHINHYIMKNETDECETPNTVNLPPPSKVSTGIVDAGADGDDNDDRLPVQGAHRWLQRAP